MRCRFTATGMRTVPANTSPYAPAPSRPPTVMSPGAKLAPRSTQRAVSCVNMFSSSNQRLQRASIGVTRPQITQFITQVYTIFLRCRNAGTLSRDLRARSPGFLKAILGRILKLQSHSPPFQEALLCVVTLLSPQVGSQRAPPGTRHDHGTIVAAKGSSDYHSATANAPVPMSPNYLQSAPRGGQIPK